MMRTVDFEELKVTAPPGTLGIHVRALEDKDGVVVSRVSSNSRLVGKVFPHDIITVLDGTPLIDMDVDQFVHFLQSKQNDYKTLTLKRIADWNYI
mmetsp:Transcript_1342/g.1266  ORF Transcript_1342/g.1266 Transcript_1342/m.1266 type:complete len:95 (-) Transcript_1342:204-488(-)